MSVIHTYTIPATSGSAVVVAKTATKGKPYFRYLSWSGIEMGDTGQPPTGCGQQQQPHHVMTPVQTGDDPTLPRRMRTFEEIMCEERQNRNILTVTLTKIVKYVDGKEERPASLTLEDIGEFIFDVVKLDVEDSAGISLRLTDMTLKRST